MLLTTSEICKNLSVHRNTVYRMISRGEIPQQFVTKIGKQYRFNSEAIEKCLLDKKVPITRTGTTQQ